MNEGNIQGGEKEKQKKKMKRETIFFLGAGENGLNLFTLVSVGLRLYRTSMW